MSPSTREQSAREQSAREHGAREHGAREQAPGNSGEPRLGDERAETYLRLLAAIARRRAPGAGPELFAPQPAILPDLDGARFALAGEGSAIVRVVVPVRGAPAMADT